MWRALCVIFAFCLVFCCHGNVIERNRNVRDVKRNLKACRVLRCHDTYSYVADPYKISFGRFYNISITRDIPREELPLGFLSWPGYINFGGDGRIEGNASLDYSGIRMDIKLFQPEDCKDDFLCRIFGWDIDGYSVSKTIAL